MIANRIPGGIISKSTEFFTVLEGARSYVKLFFSGKGYDFSDIPASRREILQSKFDSLNLEAKHAYNVISANNQTSPLEQMTMCLYGALNNEPDIDENGNLSSAEYVPCGNRKNCPFQGIGCSNILIKDGLFLSKAETEVFKLVYLEDQAIADQLFLSVFTIQKHFKNIRLKTGFKDKMEMAIWATQKGII
jgi:DNA-binding CsgD family transcriptional regulator